MVRGDYQRQKRKLHDLWALLSFIVCSCTINFIISQKEVQEPIFTIPDINTIAISILWILGSVSFLALGLLSFPKFLMHFSCILLPILSICIAFLSKNIASIILGLLFNVFYLIFYFTVIRKNVKYAAKLASDTTKIVIKHSLLMLAFITICSSALVAQIVFPLSRVFVKNEFQASYAVMVVFQFYWTLYTIFYAYRVFVSTIVGYELLSSDENISIATESFKNTLFSSGTICLGSLLIAIVSTLKFFISNRQNRSRREENILIQIFYFIILFILSVLEDIINAINEFTYTYVALFGKKYTTSVKESFDFITRHGSNILINMCCLNPILAVYGLVSGLGYIALFSNILKAGSELTQIDLINALILFSIVSTIIYLAFTTFSSAMLAFLYSFEHNNTIAKEKYPKASEALVNQKNIYK